MKRFSPQVYFVNQLAGDPELYRAWKDNIAIAFQDEFKTNFPNWIESENLHSIANAAADNFLKLLTKKSYEAPDHDATVEKYANEKKLFWQLDNGDTGQIMEKVEDCFAYIGAEAPYTIIELEEQGPFKKETESFAQWWISPIWLTQEDFDNLPDAY